MSADEKVAYALEAPPELLPFLPELLADLEELGSDAGQIAAIVAGLGLPPGTRVVDLGCGKGATARAVARATGFHVLGIDLFAPFVAHAAAMAVAEGLADRCEFRHADVSAPPPDLATFDVAIFAALGDVLGDPAATTAVLRQYVRPGGYILIADVFLRDGGSTGFEGFEHYRTRADTLRGLTTWGDHVVAEIVENDDEPSAPQADTPTTSAPDRSSSNEAAAIRERALALAERHPELRGALLAFADYQASAQTHIAEHLVDAVWVLQRPPSVNRSAAG